MKTVNALTPYQLNLITWTILSIMPIVGMAVDLIAPSLPAIANELNASQGATKNIIAIYLLGYALGNFIIGFLTDAWGRRTLLRINLFLFLIISLIPIFLHRIDALLIVRLLQGLTLGAVAVIVRAILADIYPPEKLVHMGTLIGTMWGLGPIIGPIIGGYLQFYLGWKAGFGFFALTAFILIIPVLLFIPETHHHPHKLKIKTITNHFKELLTHPIFLGLVLIMGLVYALVVSFNTLGPFLIQHQLHYSPIFFGHVALLMGICMLAATFTCRYLLKRNPFNRLYCIFINLIFIISFIGLILSYYFSQNLFLIVIISGCMFFAAGFLFPMSTGKSLGLFRHIAGTSSATMYLLNVLIASFTSFLCSFISTTDAIPLMWIYFIITFGCFMVYWLIIARMKT